MSEKSSSKVRGAIRTQALRDWIQTIADWPEVFAFFPIDELSLNGCTPYGVVSVVHVKEYGIRVRVHDREFSQDVFVASNNFGELEGKLFRHIASRGQQ